jgi:hypothetical protein
MPQFRIYYLKDPQRQHFRRLPPGNAQSGPLLLKLRDYEVGGEIEAASPYAAWKELRKAHSRRSIGVGDALETDTGGLLVCRWVGFEEARWHVPEPPPRKSQEQPAAQ